MTNFTNFLANVVELFVADESAPRKGKKSPARTRRLTLESLENRELLTANPADWAQLQLLYADLHLGDEANYNVIEIAAADLSEASLLAAIADAKTTIVTDQPGYRKPNDVIILHTTAAKNTITLSGTDIGININAGNLGSVTIVSFGDKSLTIDAGKASRVMHVGAASDVSLGGLILTGGKTTSNGGAIHLGGGTLTIANCTISGNTAAGTKFTSLGSEYTADGRGGAIYCADSGGTLTITGSTISGNTSYSYGGGIDNGQCTLTITNSIISGNTTTDSDGGGIFSYGGTLTITGSTISGNTASEGGGIYSNSSTATITDSTISGNIASGFGGSGIYNVKTRNLEGGVLTIANCTISGNGHATDDTKFTLYGGGIYNDGFYGGSLTITNSTITGNTAGMGGGGIENYEGKLTLVNCTVAENKVWSQTASKYGSGIHNEGAEAALYNTIVALNTGGKDIVSVGSVVKGFNNLTTFTGWNSPSGSNIAYSSAKPLFVNAAIGNYSLATNSQAIDKGNNEYAAIAGITKDRAGYARISGNAVDIGAYESAGAVVTPLAPPTNLAAAPAKVTTTGVTLSWTKVANAAGYQIQYSTDANFGAGSVTTVNISGGGTVSKAITGLSVNTKYYFQIKATAAATGAYTASVFSGSLEVTTKQIALAAPKSVKLLNVNPSTTLNDASLAVTWAAVKDKNGVLLASGYIVQYSTDGFKTDIQPCNDKISDANATSLTLTGLLNNKAYSVRVIAVGTDAGQYGNSLASSAAKLTTLKQAVAAPTNITLADGATAGSVKIDWDWSAGSSGAATGYTVQFSTTVTFTKIAKSVTVKTAKGQTEPPTECDVTGLTAGTKYYVRVFAIAATGFANSDYGTTTKTVTVLAKPAFPAKDSIVVLGTTSTDAAKELQVNWVAVTNAASYKIEYATNSKFTGAETPKVIDARDGGGENVTTTTLTSLSPFTTYYVRITAVGTAVGDNLFVASAVSATKSAKTAKVALAAPTNLAISARTATTLTVTWTAVAGATNGYKIEYSTTSDFAKLAGTKTVAPTKTVSNPDTFTLTNLKANTEYFVRILAVGKNESADSARTGTDGSVSQRTLLATPAISSLTPMSSTIVVKWGTIAGAAKYEVQYRVKDSGDSGWSTSQEASAVQTTLSGLNPSTKYEVRVKAIATANGNDSDWSVLKETATKALNFGFIFPPDSEVQAQPGGARHAVDVDGGNVYIKWNLGDYDLTRLSDIRITFSVNGTGKYKDAAPPNGTGLTFSGSFSGSGNSVANNGTFTMTATSTAIGSETHTATMAISVVSASEGWILVSGLYDMFQLVNIGNVVTNVTITKIEAKVDNASDSTTLWTGTLKKTDTYPVA